MHERAHIVMAALDAAGHVYVFGKGANNEQNEASSEGHRVYTCQSVIVQ